MNKKNLPLGEFLKELRKDNKLNQENVASELGLTRQAYSNYELGKCEPSMEVLERLSKLYRVSIEQFYKNGMEESRSTVLSQFEQKVIKSFSSLNLENQQEIYELILYKLAKTLAFFI